MGSSVESCSSCLAPATHSRCWCDAGLGPETVDFSLGALAKGVGWNILRPEALESICMLYRITNDTIYRDWGWQIFQAFERYSKVGAPALCCASSQVLQEELSHAEVCVTLCE